MDKNIQQKIDNWLAGNYEQSGKDAIIKLQKDNPDELADAFYLFCFGLALPFCSFALGLNSIS